MKKHKKIVTSLTALAVAAAGAWTTHQHQQPEQTPSASPAPKQINTAQLADLRIAPENPDKGYKRSDFGSWRSTGHGCNTRTTLLKNTGQDVRTSDHCRVTSGSWYSAYDGKPVSRANQLDIDHLVPLKEAYRSGADHWNRQQRENYANDPLVLIPVSKASNRSKSDQDPDSWRPSNHSSWCENANRWIEIKKRYKLTADEREQAALSDMLRTCQ